MNAYVKYGLVIGGGLLALKLFDDSKKLASALRDKANTPKPTTTIGGGQVPVPFQSDTSPELGPVNSEAGLANSNPDTSYGAGYM